MFKLSPYSASSLLLILTPIVFATMMVPQGYEPSTRYTVYCKPKEQLSSTITSMRYKHQSCIKKDNAKKLTFFETFNLLECSRLCTDGCKAVVFSDGEKKNCAQLDDIDIQQLTTDRQNCQDISGTMDVWKKTFVYPPLKDVPACPPSDVTVAIPVKLIPGRAIYIIGTVSPNATRFSVNLWCGEVGKSDLALQVDFRFTHETPSTTVLNSKKHAGDWGNQTTKYELPIKYNTPFNLTIITEQSQFKIEVDDIHVAYFIYRFNQTATYLYISRNENVTISQIKFG